MDPAARAALDASVALISPDLRFVLSERDVPEALQGKLSDAGYRTRTLRSYGGLQGYSQGNPHI